MENKASETSGLKGIFAGIAIPAAIVVSFIVFNFVLGSSSNFEGGDPANHPLPGNVLGIVYKGGIIVPILISLLLIVLTFTVERMLTIAQATGKGRVDMFIRKIQQQLKSGNITEANNLCDIQKGSVANVVKAGLSRYKEMDAETGMDREQKSLAIQKELEEATALELPMLEKNLVILATLASISTLVGLLGTVLGMIKAFSALAQSGAPDSVALANGISEALINTALGIGTSAVAIIMYNYFTTKIDKLTYSIDEAGFSIIQTFAASHARKGA